MAEGKSGWRAALWGAGIGLLGGLAFTFLHYLYEQWAHPSPYNPLMFFLYLPGCALLGALAGVLAAAWYTSD